MTKPVIPLSLSLAALVMLLGFDAIGQQRIAAIQNFMGDVEVEHSAQIIKPLKIGKVIRNGDIFDSDTVRTRKGEADLLVADGSIVRLDQNTTLYMAFEGAQPGAPAPPPAAMDRKLRLIVGRIWCDIKPSRTTTTKFELPDGVAAVRGTVVEFGVTGPSEWDAMVDRGVMSLTHTGINAQMSLKTGNKIGVRKGSAVITNLGSDEVDILLADGSKLSDFDPGDIVEVELLPDGRYIIKMLRGSAVFTSAGGRQTRLNEGDSVESGGLPPGAPGEGMAAPIVPQRFISPSQSGGRTTPDSHEPFVLEP